MSNSTGKPFNRPLLVLLVAVCVLVVAVLVVSRRKAEVPEPVRPPVQRPAEVETGTRSIALYFGSADGSKLVEVTREVPVPSDPASLLAAVMRELVSGPADKGVAVLPAGTQVRSAYFSGDNAYVDFSRELRSGFAGGSTEEYLLVGSIVRTVSENFPEVSRVQILVEGSPVESIGGHYEISEPLSVTGWSDIP